MPAKTRIPIVLILCFLGATIASLAGSDEEAIRQAVLNYANSAYLVKPDLVEKSVHPKLQKIGYVRRGQTQDYRELWMNFYELKELVAGWNKNGRFDPAA